MASISKLESNHKKIILWEFAEEVIKASAKKQGLNIDFVPKVPMQRPIMIPGHIRPRTNENMPVPKFTASVEEYSKSNIKVSEPNFAPPTRNMFMNKIPTPVIPEPRLPERFQYLKPLPSDKSIDLGKLNAFVRDPMVAAVECNGPGEEIIVVGKMGRKRTGVQLDKEEVNRIVNMFSMQTKIPVGEGVYNVVYGKFQFSAIISDILGAKFIIKKMNYGINPVFR